MPRLADLRRRFHSPSESVEMSIEDESLVFDPRNGLRPNQIVERKFGTALMREHDQQENITPSVRVKPR